MNRDSRVSRIVDRYGVAFPVLVAASFGAAFSLPLGRGLLALSAALTVVQVVRKRERVAIPVAAWLGLVFIAIAVVATVFGENPSLGVPKLRKLIWFVALPVTAILATDAGRRRLLIQAYAIGGGVLAIDLCVTHYCAARAWMAKGFFEGDLTAALIHVGSMTHGQQLMVALLAALGLVLERRAGRSGRGRFGWGALLALLTIAFVVNFKRGSWLCGLGFAVVLVGLRANWKLLALAALLGVAALLLPPVQTRMATLKSELHDSGGRMTMWTEIAPELIHRHPWGVGYRSLTNAMMREVAPGVEPRRDHLHSNPLQILVATGWLGLAVYLLWMGCGLADAVRYCRGADGDRRANGVPLVVLLGLLALLANGLVEYNFGDAEIVLLYGLLMGVAAAGGVTRRAAAPGPTGTNNDG